MLLLFAIAAPLCAEDAVTASDDGSVITFWPLFDYRSSPNEGFSNLSILGPLFKYQRHGVNRELALRPFFHRNGGVDDTTSTYLYPLASGQSWAGGSSFQVLRLFQKRTAPPEGAPAPGTMLFPFYISGTTKEHGSYVSLFPFYGDIYGRFWRDEYHYVLFPLYGRTVKGGTETSNYLYPFFSVIHGDNERGFQLWPLYGQAEKDGVYRRRTALWPVYLQEESGLDTATPTSRFYLFPLYTSSVSATRVERHVLWPFFGYVSDRERQVEERDYFWPFVRTSQGGGRTLVSYLPFYSEDRRENSVKRWYLWPLYRHDTLDSERYRRQRNRVLFFLYSDDTETWLVDDRQRRRVALWPVFTYRQDARGVSTFTFPAPVEPIFNRDGIDKSWAPLWRLYIQKWNEQGDSAVSFLWNLYWHERRQDDLAYELFPFIAYKAQQQRTDVKVLKGLVHYRRGNDGSRLNFFWLPFGVHWRNAPVAGDSAGSADKGEGH